MSEPSRKTHVIPTNTSSPEAPLAEVRVAKDRVLVTMLITGTKLSEAVVLVAANTLTIRSLPGHGDLQLTYPLPVEAELGAFVARDNNGVWDILILRSTRRSH